MFYHRPKRDRRKSFAWELCFREGLSKHTNPLPLRVIQRWTGNIHARNFIRTGKSAFQLVKEGPGRTAYIQHAPGLAEAPEQFQFALESHRRVVALELIRRQVKR